MPKRIRLPLYLTDHELHEHYRQAHDPVERSHWHFLWLLARGLTATAIARVTGYSAYWIGQIARRYNRAGPPVCATSGDMGEHVSRCSPKSTTPLRARPLPSHIRLVTTGVGGQWQHG
jgi:Homeodomain-like domain-containing protein